MGTITSRLLLPMQKREQPQEQYVVNLLSVQETFKHTQSPIYEILFLIIGTEFENGNRTWLYFGFRGGPVASDDESLPTLRFTVMNMNKQSKLFRSENILLYVHTIFFMNTNKQVKKTFHLYGKLLVDSFYIYIHTVESLKSKEFCRHHLFDNINSGLNVLNKLPFMYV